MNKKRTSAELQRPDLATYRGQDKFPIVVLLDNVRSLSNVGSIFRTSDAFKVEKVILCGITGQPPHREIQRTALGATESVAWKHCSDAGEEVGRLKGLGYRIFSLEQCEAHVAPHEVKVTSRDKVCLILGNEVEGVDQRLVDLSDEVIEIPQSGTKHSLNVTVAAGIALWELYKKFGE
ncbi:MAG: RNA methyltransferase [Flavobacteriales bacterium]|nr:RNA methyltransferase [Flavobacteriales bacterium]